MDSITILAPAFNEEENISPFLEHFYPKIDENWKILIINDGSSDNTEVNLKKQSEKFPRFSFINHKQNLGIGKAFETGFRNIETDYVITIDCDLSHTFDVVQELYANRHKADVVIASMSNKSSQYSNASTLRVLIAKLGNDLISKLIGIKVKEIAGGPRIYKSLAVKNLNIDYKGFESQVEIVKKLADKGCTFDECALYLDRRLYGESKMNYLKTIYGVIKIILFK